MLLIKINKKLLSDFLMVSFAFCTVIAEATIAEEPIGNPWRMHVVDNSSRGADGVKLADVNSDGLMDIATGWEEGGITRVYLHPGYDKAHEKWPAVTIGKTPNVEDAVFADLDDDGMLDVVTCCEGKQQSVFVHWSPSESSDLLDESKWSQDIVPDSVNKTKWMFAWPIQIDGKNGVDILAGSKKPNGQIGWFEVPANPRDINSYQWHSISPAGWVMSLWKRDMDSDGDIDIVVTDRYGDLSGCRWLENPGPGPAQSKPWSFHYMDNREHEVLSMVMHDWDKDGLEDALIAVKDFKVLFLKRLDATGMNWESNEIPANFETGNTRAVAVADINLDGKDDLAVTTWLAKGLHGVFWLEAPREGTSMEWIAHQISGKELGMKYDRIEMLDLDGDGDQDLLTCEEHEGEASKGLGVIWYENPIKD